MERKQFEAAAPVRFAVVGRGIGRAGQAVRGHEFHYSRVTEAGGDAPLAELADAREQPLGLSGARRGQVTGTFFHAIAVD